MPTCLKCQQPKRRSQMGKEPSRKTGLSPYCKTCICEQAKKGLREKSLVRLAKLVKTLPTERLLSDMNFLVAKAKIMALEIEARKGREDDVPWKEEI